MALQGLPETTEVTISEALALYSLTAVQVSIRQGCIPHVWRLSAAGGRLLCLPSQHGM